MTASQKVGRIGGMDWTNRAPALTTAVYNANYTTDGIHLGEFEKPWTAAGPYGSKRFDTHAEAIAWAFEKVGVGV